jgi:hypothetical protein
MCWRRRRDSNSCMNGYKSPKCAALCRTTTSHVGCASMLGCCLQRVPEQARRRMARKPKGQTDHWLTSDDGVVCVSGGLDQGAAVGRQPLLELERAAHADPRRVDPHARRQSRTRCSLARTLDPRMRDAESAPEMRPSGDGRTRTHTRTHTHTHARARTHARKQTHARSRTQRPARKQTPQRPMRPRAWWVRPGRQRPLSLL